MTTAEKIEQRLPYSGREIFMVEENQTGRVHIELDSGYKIAALAPTEEGRCVLVLDFHKDN
jgi:hypothetical protein